jgi:hypothetical protein
MDADAGVNCGVFGDGEVSVEIFKSCHQSDHPRNVGVTGAREDAENFLGRKTMGGKMAMGISQHGD